MHTVHSADLYYIWFYPIDALAERVESESTISLADKEQDSLNISKYIVLNCFVFHCFLMMQID